MKIDEKDIIFDERKVPPEMLRKAKIRPGAIITSEDGKTKYEVMPNGSWRRIK